MPVSSLVNRFIIAVVFSSVSNIPTRGDLRADRSMWPFGLRPDMSKCWRFGEKRRDGLRLGDGFGNCFGRFKVRVRESIESGESESKSHSAGSKMRGRLRWKMSM